jgi:tetratricopeptide (TPR) repeat protein
MKVAVYSIALNEEQFVESWYKSAMDADYLLIADTGSTDNTVKKAQDLGIDVFTISVSPWRFDDARNASLAALPKDIDLCISLDMDEVLLPGWREELEKAHKQGITRPRYKYTWSWKEDGTPGLQYGGDKIHARHGYRWKHPVHEVLVPDRIEEKQGWIDLQIEHHADSNKSRGQYLPLLETSVLESPHDERNAFYFARELYFYKNYEKATKEFKRFLSLPTATWKPERARAYRYLAETDPAHAESHLLSAISEDPNRRETLVALAFYRYKTSDWQECAEQAKKAIDIKDKSLDYLCEEFAWGAMPYDLLAIASYNIGEYEDAKTYGIIACQIDPFDKRLEQNLNLYLSK